MAVTITLAYSSGASFVQRSFDADAVKGLAKPESFRFVFRRFHHLNGSITGNIIKFARRISVDLGILDQDADQKFILLFLKSNDALITDGTYTASVVPVDPDRYEDEWIDGVQLGPKFILALDEITPLSAFQDTYVETETLILFRKVEIVGTQDSPEVFVTGVDKLATDVWGNAPPSFNAATQKAFVSIDGSRYQEAAFDNGNFEPVISGGTVTFKAAVSNAGRPASDNKYYADIAIIIQEAP